MTISIYTAPAAAGKTALCIDLARRAAADLHAEVRVAVPASLQAAAWRRRLAAHGGAIGIRVFSYDRLVAAALDAAGESYTEINRLVQYHLLRRIILREPLAHYTPLRDKPGFILVAQQLIEELKSARIDPAAFRSAVTQLGGEPRLLELAGIYNTYQIQLQEQGWADRTGLSWLAVEALAERAPDACRDWPLLIVDGFDDFTPIQLALLQTLSGRVGEICLTLPQATQTEFPRYERTRLAVEKALDRTAKPLPPQPPTRLDPALDHLARTLFARTPAGPLDQAGVVTLREVPDPAAEVRTALRWLKQQIVTHDLRPSDVALLARDMTPYRPFIGQIAAEFSLAVRMADGLPLLQSPVVAALLELLRVHLPGADGVATLARRDVVAAWRSPYFAWIDGGRTINPTDADLLDSMARQFRVIRGQAQWLAAFDAAEIAWSKQWPDDEDAEVRAAAAPDPARAGTLRDKFALFLTRTQPPAGAVTMTGFVRWLEALIGPDGSDEPVDGSLHMIAQTRANPSTVAADVAALRGLKDVLRGLVWAEDAVGALGPLDYPTFFAELYGAITTAQFDLPLRANDEAILAANVIQSRGLGFEAVAVLGLGEGSFPTTLSEDPFLRDDDRARLRERAGFELLPSTLGAEREFFYEAVTRPRRALLLTRSILADNGAEWVASPFWEAVRGLVTVEPQHIAAEQPLPLSEVASSGELWESAAGQPAWAAWAGAQQADVWPHIEAAAAIWRARQRRRSSPHNGWLTNAGDLLDEQFGRDHIWSASRLESYQTCAFMFFVGSVLRLEPRLEPAEGLDARQLGHLYHEIFEKVYAAGVPHPIESDLEAFVQRIAEPILDKAPEAEGFRETPWWSQTRQEIVANVIRSITAPELAGDEYRFLQSEAAFGFKDKPPLVIEDGDDRLLLHGFIDRVDQRDDGAIRIIDYKSAGKTNYNDHEFAEGKKLQLPLYALAAQEALHLGQVTDGFYWHFQQAEPSPFTLKNKVEESIRTARTYTWAAVRGIRDGRFQPQPPAGGCPSYCPAAAFCRQYTPKAW